MTQGSCSSAKYLYFTVAHSSESFSLIFHSSFQGSQAEEGPQDAGGCVMQQGLAVPALSGLTCQHVSLSPLQQSWHRLGDSPGMGYK